MSVGLGRFELRYWTLATTLAVVLGITAQSQQVPSPTPLGTPPTQGSQTKSPVALDQAIKLALAQASAFEQAQINQRIAAEDVRQARAAFLPRFAAGPTLIYTSPAIGVNTPPNTPRPPSFIGANAITEYQGLATVSGELDTAGRLRATLHRNIALLEAAHAGTEAARRTLVQATEEAYYGLALAVEKREAAEQNVSAAEEFERNIALLVEAGEAAPVDRTRARLQTSTRRDELDQARAGEVAAADSLRVLIGFDFSQPLRIEDVSATEPVAGEIQRFTADAISRRPEFSQFAAEHRAGIEELKAARAERRPQLIYSVSGGFGSDSLRPPNIKEHTGVSATVGVSIPIFDWGVSRSRERQAQLRLEATDSANALAQRTFAEQFFTARAQALIAEDRIRRARASIPDAEQNLVASLARYRAGEAQLIEVTDAQNTLVTQRTSLYQAIFDYRIARTRLRQATGQ